MEAPVIAGYRCGRLLGVGGMGAVFLAQRDSDGTTVAIKVIRPTDDPHSEAASRMRRELELSKSFAHPYLPKILDGGALPSKLGTYIVMEFLDGLDLAHAACKIQVTDTLLRRIMTQVTEALSYIHARGLIHRDVKPANIFLAKGERTVLLDFGLAYASDRTQLTRTGTVLGTVPFMAPEQLRGEPLTPAADIYGLGAAAVAALTGTPPFDPADVLALVTGAPRAVPLRPPPIRGLVSDHLASLILRCIAFDPSKRFPTADALSRALVRPPRHLGHPTGLPPDDESGPHDEVHPSSNAKPARPARDPAPFRIQRAVAVLMALTLLLGGLFLIRRGPRVTSHAPPPPPVSSALREVLETPWPPGPETLARLDRALVAADMTSRYALPSTLSPQARALTWLGLKARDEGRYDDGARFLTLALERCGPFCLASSIHDAPALTLEMARLAGTSALLAEHLDALAHEAKDPRIRGRLAFTARQAHIQALSGARPTPEAWMAQVLLLEPWLGAPPPSVRPVEVAVALMTALSGVRTPEARDRVIRVMEGFPRVGPDVPPADLVSLRHQAFRALTQESEVGQPARWSPDHVRNAVDLAHGLAALLLETGSPRRTAILVSVASGLDRVGRQADAWRIIRPLAASPLLPAERCDVHRTQASLYTGERNYEAAMNELRAAEALATEDWLRSSIRSNQERLRQMQILMPATREGKP